MSVASSRASCRSHEDLAEQVCPRVCQAESTSSAINMDRVLDEHQPLFIACGARRFDPLECFAIGGWKLTLARESFVKVVVYLLAGGLALLGLLFVVAAGQGNALMRIIIGVICIVASGALVALLRLKPTHHVHHTQLDLTGDVSLQEITCNKCGATLSQKSLTVTAGAVFVRCEFCSAEYQMEEAPKW